MCMCACTQVYMHILMQVYMYYMYVHMCTHLSAEEGYAGYSQASWLDTLRGWPDTLRELAGYAQMEPDTLR